MTLQQMEFIVTIDKFHSLKLASNELNVTPSALSNCLKSVEDELGQSIFERTSKNMITTPFGRIVIEQAEITLKNAYKIKELATEESGKLSGNLKLSFGTTISAYIVPELIDIFYKKHPSIVLEINESRKDRLIEDLILNRFDISIELSGLLNDKSIPINNRKDIFEIPLYREKYYIYSGKNCNCKNSCCSNSTMHVVYDNLYVMPNYFNNNACCIGNIENKGKYIYSSGSIDNLIRIVDKNNGYTLIPELHLQFLSEEQKKRIDEVDKYHTPYRDISIYIHKNFVRESMLNTVIDAIKCIIPIHMIDKNLRDRKVRL